jgi:hypothetical protein
LEILTLKTIIDRKFLDQAKKQIHFDSKRREWVMEIYDIEE